MLTNHILATVEPQRLLKAVEGLVSGAYTVTVTAQSEAEIRGFVANGDGKEYGVILSEGQSYCGCKDAIYRRGICKHAVILALHAIRSLKAEQSTPSRGWHVGDTVQRNGHTGIVVCVSGEFVSIRWDSGRTFPLTQEELAEA